MVKLPFISWFGGKYRLVKHLLPLIPQHTTYVEVFGGGANLLINKSQSKVEIYNDIHDGLVAIYRSLRNHPQEFKKLLELTPYARAEYDECVHYADCDSELEKARRFFTMLRSSYGSIEGGGFCNPNKRSPAFRSACNRIDEYIKRFEFVCIENSDFKKLIERYDHIKNDTFFYIDPPYLQETRQSFNDYRFELDNQMHVDLIDMLLKTKSKVLLSGYDNSIYSKLESAGWHKKQFETYCSTGLNKDGSRPKRTETVWFNYEIKGITTNE